MPTPELIDAEGLAAKLKEDDLLLVDVRLSEDHEAERLPGARTNCVFEVNFADRLEALGVDPGREICVYGAASDSHEARMAAEKLERLGFEKVWEFHDGLDGWKAAGLATESGKSIPETPAIADGVHVLDLRESKLEWQGRNLLNKHWGTVGLRRGELTFRDGRIVYGRVSIDMTDLRCDDLYGDPLHDVLVATSRVTISSTFPAIPRPSSRSEP